MFSSKALQMCIKKNNKFQSILWNGYKNTHTKTQNPFRRMDPQQTYFTPGLSFPRARLLLLRENPSLESMVSQARLTQGRLKVWFPWWHVDGRGARVLQAGTLMLVHTDHWALDPSSYLQCAKERKSVFYLLWCLMGLWREIWWDGHSWKESLHFSVRS